MPPGARSQTCDVLIAGGGPAGASAALALLRQGATVVVADPGRRQEWKPGESLSAQAGPLLDGLGVLDRVTSGPHTQCSGNDSAWGESLLTGSHALLDPLGPGWHLDRLRFDQVLLQAAHDAGARQRHCQVRSLERHAGHWRITLGEDTILARYVIDATGASASVARRIGAQVRRDDRLVALVARLPSGAVHRDVLRTSLVESVPFGWWYTAPLPGGTALVMAMTDADVAARHRLHRPEVWWRELTATTHVRARLRLRVTSTPPPVELRIVRAATSSACPAAGPGWAAVGDAATASDPIAARGITTALATGISAADAVRSDADGVDGPLLRYAERVEAVHTEYLLARAVCYGIERRWDTPFWTRRRVEPGTRLPAARA
ncbi:NAD(P)/FAD-dependent oxidoreductase [Streptomyces sp. NPDC096339]|uniref:NAD(P)/FAD-dependent oxidoreductase n=1 Tax=Streptomyces sp. NPDC096339 TaxID=3366086 RepID=UPI00380988A4